MMSRSPNPLATATKILSTAKSQSLWVMVGLGMMSFAPLTSAAAFPLLPAQKTHLAQQIQFFGKESEPAPNSAAAEDVVRIDRLENQIRTLNGQIEQMQYDIQKLQDQLKRAQQENESRPENAGKTSPTRPASTPNLPPTAPVPAPAPSTGKRGDAFDPAAHPDAAGAPKTLGAFRDGQALDLNPPDNASAPLIAPTANAPAAPIAGVSTPEVISAPSPRENYDLALEAYKQGQWSDAQNGLRAFIAQNPNDKLIPDALFYLGMSFDQQGRSRDAAEHYLKVSTDYAKSPRAPEALVKLGLALQKLGAKEQACATFGEALRKYPSMSAALKASAERESKRAQC
jgi:tol-pal system protein YbgF